MADLYPKQLFRVLITYDDGRVQQHIESGLDLPWVIVRVGKHIDGYITDTETARVTKFEVTPFNGKFDLDDEE